jgi:H+/Cl- antiporter ClcA
MTQATLPRFWQVILSALVAIVFTAVFMTVYQLLLKAVWEGSFVSSNRWTIPVGVMSFSLLVGLAQRYLRAPTAIEGGLAESMKGEGTSTDYTTFPGAVVTAMCSLLSGASVGPEGAIAVMVQDISAWFRQRLRVPADSALGFDVAALASAFNGIVGSPLFTAIFATEYQVGGRSGLLYLGWNLLAGVIGFGVYELLGLPSFAALVPFSPVGALMPAYFIWAILLGVVGAALALLIGAMLQLFGRLIPRVFQERVIERALVAGVVVSLVGFALPDLLFSGEEQIHTIVADPAAYGFGLLLLLAFLKIVLLGVSIKSGYLGGPIFPVLFTCTTLGMALHLLAPDVPESILVLCIEGPAVALALNAPLTAIVLVSVLGTSNPDMVALITLSTVVGLVVGSGVKAAMARRAAPTDLPAEVEAG